MAENFLDGCLLVVPLVHRSRSFAAKSSDGGGKKPSSGRKQKTPTAEEAERLRLKQYWKNLKKAGAFEDDSKVGPDVSPLLRRELRVKGKEESRWTGGSAGPATAESFEGNLGDIDPDTVDLNELRERLGLGETGRASRSERKSQKQTLALLGLEDDVYRATKRKDQETLRSTSRAARVARNPEEFAALEAEREQHERARARLDWMASNVQEDLHDGYEIPRELWKTYGLPNPPEEIEEPTYKIDDQWNTSHDETDEQGMVRPMFGSSLRHIPLSVVREASQPFRDAPTDEATENEAAGEEGGKDSEEEEGGFDPKLRPHERVIDAERRQLKKKFMQPMVIPNRPLFDVSIAVLDMSQTHKVVPGGLEATNRALVVCGNGQGGVGYGFGRHENAAKATSLAIDAAERDMIYVSTYKGQLYHDLVGKKNNIRVMIQPRGPAHDHPGADNLISTVMELAGIRNYSAKVIGPKRRNIYTVIQALFDAFNYHLPYQEQAFKRGQRLVHMSEHRMNPRGFYANTHTGPRHIGSKYSNRFTKGAQI